MQIDVIKWLINVSPCTHQIDNISLPLHHIRGNQAEHKNGSLLSSWIIKMPSIKTWTDKASNYARFGEFFESWKLLLGLLRAAWEFRRHEIDCWVDYAIRINSEVLFLLSELCCWKACKVLLRWDSDDDCTWMGFGLVDNWSWQIIWISRR